MNWADFKLEGKNVSEVLFQAERAKMIVEDTILDHIPEFPDFDTWVDDYDSSLEIKVKVDMPRDYTVTLEQIQPLFDYGFNYIFINYKDGTEQHCYHNEKREHVIGDRRPK